MFRVGFGYDVHRLVRGRALIIGGCHIPHQLGLLGHSDADVLTHAIIDAILGALAKGDIGKHFPDTDPEFKNIDSRILLKQVFDLMIKNEYELVNADITILAQAPKMAPHLAAMKANLAADLEATIDQINIKASTTERMGFVGRGEGIVAYAVVLLAKQ